MKDMEEKYILNLERQFYATIGTQNLDSKDEKELFKTKIFLEGLKIWINKMKKCSIDYQGFIQYLGVDIHSASTTELRKGIADSIALDEMTIVSPFAGTLGYETMDLTLIDHEPVIIDSTKKIRNDIMSSTESFLTQNPYSREYLNGLDSIGHIGKGLTIGAYGYLQDKDKDEKIKLLQSFGEKKLPSFREEYETLRDKYFYVLQTEKKEILKRTR